MMIVYSFSYQLQSSWRVCLQKTVIEFLLNHVGLHSVNENVPTVQEHGASIELVMNSGQHSITDCITMITYVVIRNRNEVMRQNQAKGVGIL